MFNRKKWMKAYRRKNKKKIRAQKKRWARKAYIKNNKPFLIRNKKWHIKNLEYNNEQIRKYKEKHPCVDCGNPDFRVLHFHYLKNKKASISDLARRCSWKRIQKEIEKCIVLCANYHMIRHYEEKSSS